MAEPTMKDLQEAFSAGSLLTFGSSEIWSAERVQNAFDEWLGEDRVDLLGEPMEEEQDPTEADLSEDCRTVYSMLDELEEQLNEAAGELYLDKDEDILRLIEDFKACKRVRKLVKELLDPQYVPAQAADVDPDGS